MPYRQVKQSSPVGTDKYNTMTATSSRPTKVYARFHTDEKSGLTYRTNTILQFGNSWNIIGAAVLTNPGSAIIAEEKVSEEALKQLANLTGNNDNWSIVNFSRDTTIRDWLPRIFNGYFAQQGEDGLSGIILLYNLFNIKNQDLGKAVESYQKAQSPFLYTTAADIALINKAPIVYLGWGNVAKNGLFKERAVELFSAINPKLRAHYDPAFEKNTFYHPRAVNMGYKRWNGVKNLMSAFYKKISELKY